MVKIRLRRMGAKKSPFYRIVVADSRSPRDGRFVESLGTYDTTAEPAAIQVDRERVLWWLSKGAQMTQTVKSIFKKTSVFSGAVQ